MNICYLLESTELSGGVRVVFDQARALKKRGHKVLIRAARGNHKWYPHQIDVAYVSDLSSDFNPGVPVQDVVIATFWTTVYQAMRLKSAQKFHLCQGYEGSSIEYSHSLLAIEEAYKVPIPKLTIGDWLSDRLVNIFGPDSFKIHNIGQIVDLELFTPSPLLRQNSSRKVRTLVSGVFDADVKAIKYALNAIALLRKKKVGIQLIRVSPVNTAIKEQAITGIDQYYTHISPAQMTKIYHNCDMFIAPSLSHEGFGLPFAEALACGIPSVATAIPSHLSFDKIHDYACFVPEKDPAAMVNAALNIIEDRHLQKHLRNRGIEIVNKNFRSEDVAERLEVIFSNALK